MGISKIYGYFWGSRITFAKRGKVYTKVSQKIDDVLRVYEATGMIQSHLESTVSFAKHRHSETEESKMSMARCVFTMLSGRLKGNWDTSYAS